MLKLQDFKVGDTVYIVYMYTGYNTSPKIVETEVKKVGRIYVTTTCNRRFERNGNYNGLLEHSDWGQPGILYNKREDIEIEIKRQNLIKNIRAYSHRLSKYSYTQLKEIMKILKDVPEVQPND